MSNETPTDTKLKMAREALARAQEDKSHANYQTILAGFSSRGIPESEILPRVNVFTYHAWRAKGRQVKKGEKGVRIETVFEKLVEDKQTKEKRLARIRRPATVFHISQTCELGDEPLEADFRQSPSPIPQPEPFKPRPCGGDVSLAGRFREKAERLLRESVHKSRPMSGSFTAKRNRQYRSRLHDANCDLMTRDALLVLAELHEKNEVPKELCRFRNIKHVAEAVRLCCEIVHDAGGYVVTKFGEFVDDRHEARFLQALVCQPDGPTRESAKLNRILELETKLRTFKLDGFFPTPPDLAEFAVELADIDDAHEVLEPSAGIGSVAEVISQRHPRSELICVERNATMCELLELKGFQVICGDFLETQGQVDRIVMNPPFEKRADADHVRHAYTLLNPGGILVAIMSRGTWQSSDRKSTEFREWFSSLDGSLRVRDFESAFQGADAFNPTSVAVTVVQIIA